MTTLEPERKQDDVEQGPEKAMKTGKPVQEMPPMEIPSTPVQSESRFVRFIKTALLWFGISLILLIIGAAAIYFAYYRPVQEQLDQTRSELVQANQAVETLEARIESLQVLETTNRDLQIEILDEQTHVVLLKAYANVVEAQVALEQENPGSVRTSLNRATGHLKDLKTMVDEDQQGPIDEILARLQLALTEIDTDAFAVESDLEVLSAKLIQLENDLFGELTSQT